MAIIALQSRCLAWCFESSAAGRDCVFGRCTSAVICCVSTSTQESMNNELGRGENVERSMGMGILYF